MSVEQTIGIAVAGWLATTYLAYRWGLRSKSLERKFAQEDAKAQRRREFIAFMEHFKAEAELVGAGARSHNSTVRFLPWLRGTVPDIRHSAAKVVDAIPETQQETFNTIIENTCSMTDAALQVLMNEDRFKDVADPAIQFVRSLK